MFAGEPFSGAAKAGVNFIENQQRAEFVAQFSEQRQKFRRRNVDAAARLDWFDENCADASAPEEVSDLKFNGRQIGIGFWERGEISEFAELRLKRSPEKIAMRDVERAVAESVIRAGKSDDAVPAGGKNRRFERGFDGFKTGIAENRFAGRMICESLNLRIV